MVFLLLSRDANQRLDRRPHLSTVLGVALSGLFFDRFHLLRHSFLLALRESISEQRTDQRHVPRKQPDLRLSPNERGDAAEERDHLPTRLEPLVRPLALLQELSGVVAP